MELGKLGEEQAQWEVANEDQELGLQASQMGCTTSHPRRSSITNAARNESGGSGREQS